MLDHLLTRKLPQGLPWLLKLLIVLFFPIWIGMMAIIILFALVWDFLWEKKNRNEHRAGD